MLFKIGPFNVYAFGILLAISFVLSTFVVWKHAKEELKEEEYLDIFLYTAVVALISARIVYIIFNFSKFQLNILRYILVRETPGLSLFGGFLGGFVFLYFFVRKNKLNLNQILDIFSLGGSLALVFAKIGELLGGAGFGKQTDFFLGLSIVGQDGRRHILEIYEVIIYLFTFVLLTIIYNRTQKTTLHKSKYPAGFVFLIFSQVFLITNFGLEFLKDYSVYLLGLSLKQIISVILLLFTIHPMYKKINVIKQERKRTKT